MQANVIIYDLARMWLPDAQEWLLDDIGDQSHPELPADDGPAKSADSSDRVSR